MARRRLTAVLLLLPLAGLGGCLGAQVEVPTDFPVPLLQRLPINVGLVLSDELTSFAHEESLPDNGDWRIVLGPAQQTMFNNLFSGMFEGHQLVTGTSAEDQGTALAGVMVPSIEEVQFAIPSQTRSDYFEVWIRYQIKLYDNGALLGEWPITAYGKANTQNYRMSGTSPALQAAAFAACRDAMAYFAVEFQRVPAVRTWLATQSPGASS
jgi:hypothetical protein